MVIFRQQPVLLEVKSRAGIASKAQKRIRAELVEAGAAWWLVRTARAALMALRLSGVEVWRPWRRPELMAWEGPFDDPNKQLPQAPLRPASAIVESGRRAYLVRSVRLVCHFSSSLSPEEIVAAAQANGAVFILFDDRTGFGCGDGLENNSPISRCKAGGACGSTRLSTTKQ
jgi:hypothetical protein